MNIKLIDGKYQSLCAEFNSGNYYLDNFLKSNFAYDSALGKTYLFLTDDETDVIGYDENHNDIFKRGK